MALFNILVLLLAISLFSSCSRADGIDPRAIQEILEDQKESIINTIMNRFLVAAELAANYDIDKNGLIGEINGLASMERHPLMKRGMVFEFSDPGAKNENKIHLLSLRKDLAAAYDRDIVAVVPSRAAYKARRVVDNVFQRNSKKTCDFLRENEQKIWDGLKIGGAIVVEEAVKVYISKTFRIEQRFLRAVLPKAFRLRTLSVSSISAGAKTGCFDSMQFYVGRAIVNQGIKAIAQQTKLPCVLPFVFTDPEDNESLNDMSMADKMSGLE